MESSHVEISFSKLAIILDLNPLNWAKLLRHQSKNPQNSSSTSKSHIHVQDVLDLILSFSHQYSCINRDNRISLITLSPHCTLHYPQKTGSLSSQQTLEITKRFEYEEFKSSLQEAAKSITDKYSTLEFSNRPIDLASGLSRAFLHLHRLDKELIEKDENDSEIDSFSSLLLGSTDYPSRILIFTLSQDSPSFIIPCMNSIFAAHKKGITIDVCVLASSQLVSSPLLQVASELTSGYYTHVETKEDLQRTLLADFLVDFPFRQNLNFPKIVKVDHRALCFCHRKFVSIGYVCSVCLAVYCQTYQSCETCGATFAKDAKKTN